jgi:hypothetical protein
MLQPGGTVYIGPIAHLADDLHQPQPEDTRILQDAGSDPLVRLLGTRRCLQRSDGSSSVPSQYPLTAAFEVLQAHELGPRQGVKWEPKRSAKPGVANYQTPYSPGPLSRPRNAAISALEGTLKVHSWDTEPPGFSVPPRPLR